jgi:ATP-dependent Clp protease ATP-binding subunit ClpA
MPKPPEEAMAERQKNARPAGKDAEKTISVLAQVATELGAHKTERRFGSIVPWKSEVTRLLETLQKRSNHNVLLHGPVGVGKRTMVLRLAEQITHGNVSPRLRNKRILEITLPSVLPYVQEPGDFERVLFHAIKEAVEREDVILYFNQIENFIGQPAGASGDASALLDIASRQPELQIIASMSEWAYQHAVFEHPWIQENLVPIRVSEPSPELARRILRVVRGKLERFHGIEITADAVDKAIDLSSYYLRSRVLPGKALEILDEACAAEVVRARGDRRKPACVDADAVGETVSRRLGIPVEKLYDRAGGHLLRLEENLRAYIKGQDEVVRRAADVIRVAKLGLSAHPERPDGSLLLIGPSGVGKNQIARRLAIELFGSTDHLLHLDMAQFTGEDAAQKLLGTRGTSGVKGILATLVERRPNAILLVDGVEKAHPKVGPILLQILKEGRISDEEGRQLSFTGTTVVVIANSDNLFPDEEQKTVGFLDSDQAKTIETQRRAIQQAADEFFAADFLHAFDAVLYLDPLTPESVREIAEIEIHSIRERLEQRGIALIVHPDVIRLVAERGYSPHTGAHQLRRTVENLVLQPVSMYLLENLNAKRIVLDVEGETIHANGSPLPRTRAS